MSRVAEELLNGVCDRSWVLGIEERAASPATSRATAVGARDRNAARHRLEHREAEALVQATETRSTTRRGRGPRGRRRRASREPRVALDDRAARRALRNWILVGSRVAGQDEYRHGARAGRSAHASSRRARFLCGRFAEAVSTNVRSRAPSVARSSASSESLAAEPDRFRAERRRSSTGALRAAERGRPGRCRRRDDPVRTRVRRRGTRHPIARALRRP